MLLLDQSFSGWIGTPSSLVRTRSDAGIVYDEERWMTAYSGFANAISMDTEEGLSRLNSDSPIRILE